MGSSDIYYAINKDRADIKEELDNAMRALEDADPFYTADLYKRYFSMDYTPILTGEEKAWLKKHGAIRMGFLTGDSGVSVYDPSTGELTGTITDYIRFAKDCLGNQELEFQMVGYDSQKAELDALKSGEIDMVFHFDQSPNLAEEYGVYGGAFTRNINIYGQPYAPAKSLTIDASNLRTFYTGDTFNPAELVVTATRANGAEESIWGGRLTFTGYDSDTTGTKTVTASFLGATATFEVQVEDLVTEQYTGSYELVQGETPTATDAVLLVDYSHKVCTLTAADGSASITGTLVDAQDDALTMTLNGSDALTVPITEGEDGSKQLTIPAHDEIVSGWGSSTTYSINEAVVTLAAE